MNTSQRLRTYAKHTGLYSVIELLQEAADEIDALQARAQVQGEAFGYIHHFAAHDESGVLIDTTWEADGCADPLPHPTFPSMWEWTHCAPFYTTPQPAQATQATQATPSIPSDGPSTYEQRFTAAVAMICGVTPPATLVCDWINKAERHDDLQQWVGSYAPGWVQNIAVLDAAHQMADQPTEGGDHEPAQQATQTEVTDEQILSLDCVSIDSDEHGTSFWVDRSTVIKFARAILAHRPERVPMTPASRDVIMATRTANADADEWPEPWAYQRGWNNAEAHHGITAQAKKEQT